MKKVTFNNLNFIQLLIFAFLLLTGFSHSVFAIEQPLVFPIPQSLQITNDDFILDESVTILVPENATENDNSLVRLLTSELTDKYGLAIKSEIRSDIPDNKKVIILGSTENSLIKEYLDDESLKFSAQNLAPELAEYPGDNWPDTYCPSNPASYELLFEVYDEYIDVIQPKMVHIGHDEWRIPMDVCPKCKGKDFTKLYIQDVNKIYNYLKDKGIKTAMWGDHLLESVRNAGPREAVSFTGVKYQKPGALSPKQVRDLIPKDIIVFNWFWGDEEKEQELQEFGFKQFFGNFKPNISNWDERIERIDLTGGAPSSWAATNEFNFGKDLFFDFLGCANLLWSNHTLSQPELAKIVKKQLPSIRANLNNTLIPSEDDNEVDFIDINSNFNFPVQSKAYIVDFSTLKNGTVANKQKTFKLVRASNTNGNCAIAIGSVGAGENVFSPELKAIQVNDDVSSLLFLNACASPAGNQKAYYNIPDFFDTADLLGWYEIVYEDSYRINIPVQYGVNIMEWNAGAVNNFDQREGETGSPQNVYCYLADPVQCSSDEQEKSITFYAYEWVNPRFGKIIKEVNMFGSMNYHSTQPAGNPETKPMKSNAIFLVALSKVVKREPFKPGE